MCVFSAKIWFIKTLTRTVKYESNSLNQTLLEEYSTYGKYGVPLFSFVISAILILLERMLENINIICPWKSHDF